MRKLLFVLVIFVFSFIFPVQIAAQTQSEEFVTGEVTAIIEEQELSAEDTPKYIQTLEVTRDDTKEKVQIHAGSEFQPLEDFRRIPVGRKVIVSKQATQNGEEWVLVDASYRLPVLGFLVLLFFFLVVAVARLQGIFSIVGMLVSFVILIIFVLPQVLSGANPVLISIVAAMIIGAASMYLSHGINLKSHIAFGSIVITLITVGLLSSLVLRFAHMNGTGSEEAIFLLVDPANKVNLQGLLLAGIVLGTLGILDDICIAQVSVVKELVKAKPHISLKELLQSGLAVGKDHIASLVNTLILAYAGASLPLFLLFSQNNTRPWWVVLNDEMIAEEIVRTLSGSIGLVLAVPFATIVAAIILRGSKDK